MCKNKNLLICSFPSSLLLLAAENLFNFLNLDECLLYFLSENIIAWNYAETVSFSLLWKSYRGCGWEMVGGIGGHINFWTCYYLWKTCYYALSALSLTAFLKRTMMFIYTIFLVVINGNMQNNFSLIIFSKQKLVLKAARVNKVQYKNTNVLKIYMIENCYSY